MRSPSRALLLSAALSLVPVIASAGPWRTGAHVGLSLTSIHGDFADLIGPDNKLGLQGGGFVELSPGPVGLAVEVNYIEKGFTTISEGTDQSGNPTGTVEGHLKLQYLEVPVLLRGSLPLEGPWTPYAVLGPTFGFTLGGEFEPGFPGFADQDVTSDMTKVDMGGTVGVGAIFGRGVYRMMLETRYFTGFSDLWDISGNLESINHGFGFTVGVVR